MLAFPPGTSAGFSYLVYRRLSYSNFSRELLYKRNSIEMSLLVKNGKIVNHDRSFKSDVLIKDGKIIEVAENIQAPVKGY